MILYSIVLFKKKNNLIIENIWFINLPLKQISISKIILNTIKGKGIPFYENTFESHYKILSKSEFEKIKNL